MHNEQLTMINERLIADQFQFPGTRPALYPISMVADYFSWLRYYAGGACFHTDG